MKAFKRPFTGAALLATASLSLAVWACPLVGMTQDQTTTTAAELTPQTMSPASIPEATRQVPQSADPPCKQDCIPRYVAYSYLRTYDSRQDENTTYQGEFMVQPRSKSDYSHVVPTRGDTPEHQHFRWDYRRFDIDSGKYLGPLDPDGARAHDINAIKDSCVTDTIAADDQENGTSEMIPLAKLKEWGFMTVSCVDQALSKEEEGDSNDAFLCMRDGDGDSHVADHCFGWPPEKVIHHALHRSTAQNDQPKGK